MGLYQTTMFCTEKKTINKIKIHSTKWENMYTNDTSNKVLISKMYKEVIKLNTKKKKTKAENNPIKE